MISIIILILIIVKTTYLLFTKKIGNSKSLYSLLLFFGIYILLFSKFNNNFIIIRFILIYLMFDFSKFIINKNDKIMELLNNRKNSIRYFITLIILILGVWLIPFEQLYMEFNNVEEIFNYSFPNEEILKTYEGKKDAIVIYKDGMASTYFEKNNKENYEFSAFNNSANYKSIPSKITRVNDKLVIGVNTTKNNTKLIRVSGLTLRNVQIEDSLNSEFYKFDNIAFTMVDYDVHSYYIVVNGEKFEFNF